ncbi:phosphoglucosamine mutase [bacterium J17]|nr:phosphoglucosamine mutase [bacterium J17]
MGSLFGTDGVRGVANLAPMDSETVMRLGRAAAHVFRRSEGRHRILIGKDTRVSGYMLETALCSGLSSMGVDVLLVGPLPTPGVAFMTRSMRADAGVMISASHNPYEDNGIKFFGADGFKLPDETEAEIERLMEPGHLDELRADPHLIGKAARIEDAIGRYTVYLKSCVEREANFEGVKIVIDNANGAAYKVAPLVFSELGADLIIVGDEPNGRNINDGCGSTHPEVISEKVREHGADAGIAYDGDADRVIFCDEKGEVVDGDLLLAICALDFKARGILQGGGVVGTVMSNLGLEVALNKEGIELHRSSVGDRYVLAEMLERGINLGGEQSGHLISLDHNTTGDGILSSLLVLSVMLRDNKPLSSYRTLLTPYPQLLINVQVTSKPPLTDLPKVRSAIAAAEDRLGKRGRVLVRYSGTEKKARVMVECEDDAMCKEVAEEIAAAIKQEIGAK